MTSGQGSILAEAVQPASPPNVPVQPVSPPVRWHDTSQEPSADIRSSVQQPPGEFPPAPAQPASELPTRVDVPSEPLAAAQPSPLRQPARNTKQPALPEQISPVPPRSAQPVPVRQYASETETPVPGPTPELTPPVQHATPRLGAFEAKAGSRQWEDQKVRQAASKLAEQLPGVKKGKICYSVKTDEWWVVLYDDSGAVYDVKQYTWNREQEKLERFLVLKRIAKNRLEEDLSGREPDRACEPIDFP